MVARSSSSSTGVEEFISLRANKQEFNFPPAKEQAGRLLGARWPDFIIARSRAVHTLLMGLVCVCFCVHECVCVSVRKVAAREANFLPDITSQQ